MGNAKNIVENEAIDVSDYPAGTHNHNGKTANVYDKTLCQDNKQLTDFLNKCILLDQTVEMEGIINKVLLPSYVRADNEYKRSDKFKRVLTKALKRLINEPDKKYSHISDVNDTLKLHVKTPQKKKRVGFVTLTTTVLVEPKDNTKRHIVHNTDVESPKKRKLDVIAVDCDEDDDVIAIDDLACETVADNPLEVITDVTNVKNDTLVDDGPIEIQDSQELKIEEMQTDNKESNDIINDGRHTEENDKENLGINDTCNDSGDKLLVPQMEIVQLEKKPIKISEEEKTERIKEIEAEIAKAKKKIAELELAEVADDSAVSPYIQCHKLEAHIVKLYNELCSLVDAKPVKRRKVRLQVYDGQPEGPVRRLEKFLNKQVNEEGVAPFPDFNDVVRCVEKANVKDGLGWSKAKVLREAQAMFGYCGRALQKRRQQREWKHMKSRVRLQDLDEDPAERDRELLAKLELNRQLAMTKEAEILEKFSRMETVSVPKIGDLHHDDNTQEREETEHSTSDEGTPPRRLTKTNKPASQLNVKNSNLKEDNNNATCNLAKHETSERLVVVKQEPEEVLVNIQYKGDISLVIEISDSDSSDDEE